MWRSVQSGSLLTRPQTRARLGEQRSVNDLDQRAFLIPRVSRAARSARDAHKHVRVRDVRKRLQRRVVHEPVKIFAAHVRERVEHARADVRPRVVGKFTVSDDTASPYGIGGEWSAPDPAANRLLRANADL